MPILDPEDLAKILADGEGRQAEFKEGLAPDGRVARTICAFANTRGGILLVGVSDQGLVRGVARAATVADEIAALGRNAVVPAVEVLVDVLRVRGRPVVVCSVPLSPRRPHVVKRSPGSFAPEVLVRAGASNRAATGRALDDVAPKAVKPSPLDALVLHAARGAGTTIAAFAEAHAVGKQRARRSFELLERAGLLIAHGLFERRVYRRA
jgi:hypothetical protein